jgi:hypothetical protein
MMGAPPGLLDIAPQKKRREYVHDAFRFDELHLALQTAFQKIS